MTHTTTWRGRDTGDEAHHWLVWVTVGLEPLGGLFFGRTTDLTNHDDTFRLWVVRESLETVDEVGAVEWITTDTNDGRLTKASRGRLVHGLVREGTRTRDDTDLTLLVDVARHDTHLTLTRLDDTWAVRTDQARGVLLTQVPLDLDHVLLWDTLGNGDNQRDLGLDGVDDGLGAEWRRHVDHRGVGARLLLGFRDRVEHWETQVRGTALLWGHTTDHVGAVRNRLLRVERTLAGETLADDLGVLVDPDLGGGGHGARGLRHIGLDGSTSKHLGLRRGPSSLSDWEGAEPTVDAIRATDAHMISTNHQI